MRNPITPITIFKYFALTFIYLFIWLIILSKGSCTLYLKDVSLEMKCLILGLYIVLLIVYNVMKPMIKRNDNQNILKKLDMQYVGKREEYTKYLFFRQGIISTVKEEYYISNQKGDIYYKIYLSKITPSEYTVENYKKEKVAIIKTSLLSSINLENIIEIKNKHSFKIKRNKDGIYTLNNTNYILESNNIYNEHNKIKQGNKILAQIDVASIGAIYEIGNYDIILNDKTIELETICITASILINSNIYRNLTSND